MTLDRLFALTVLAAVLAVAADAPLTPVEACTKVEQKVTVEMTVRAIKDRLEKRGEIYAVSYIVGLDVQGNRHLISHRLAGSGGLNQTRRQINKLIREDKADVLCQAVAEQVAQQAALPYHRIVAVRIVTGRFRFADYFGGNKAPLTERVHATCRVVRDEASKDGPAKEGKL